MNSENRKKLSSTQVITLTFFEKGKKSLALSNISIYYTQKNTTKSHKNNKFKMSSPK